MEKHDFGCCEWVLPSDMHMKLSVPDREDLEWHGGLGALGEKMGRGFEAVAERELGSILSCFFLGCQFLAFGF